MKHDDVPFDAVLKVLEAHGYVLALIKGSHRVFVHGDASKPSIPLPLSPKNTVRRSHVRAIQRILDESSVLPADEFAIQLKNAG